MCKVSHLQTSLQFFDLGQRVERQYLDRSERLKGSKTRKVPKGWGNAIKIFKVSFI